MNDELLFPFSRSLSVAMDKKEGVMYSTMGSMLKGVRDVKQGGEISAAVEKL